MSKEVKIDANGVSITLTKEQISEIDRQRNKSKSVTERIQTFDDIIAECGRPASYFMDSSLPKHELGYRKFVAICEVYNEGWIPDFIDGNQRKWYIYGTNFDITSSSFGFSAADCAFWNTYAYGSSRLCLKSENLANDIIKKFLKELNEFWC